MIPNNQLPRHIQGMSLDQSMRVYQDLIQQNLQLKQQIQRSKVNKCYSSTNLPSPSTAYRTTIYQQSPIVVPSSQQYFSSSSKQYSPPKYITSKYSPSKQYYTQQKNYYSPLTRPSQIQYYQKNIDYDVKQQNQHYLEQLIQKNKYLEQKIDRLKQIHFKQHSDIEQIRRSRQWESRFDCKEDTCYQDKYMQLLRVRSPFY